MALIVNKNAYIDFNDLWEIHTPKQKKEFNDLFIHYQSKAHK